MWVNRDLSLKQIFLFSEMFTVWKSLPSPEMFQGNRSVSVFKELSRGFTRSPAFATEFGKLVV